MTIPLVSICIPTYNGARWLEETLHSALAQTYSGLEILIVDDNSTDGTLDVVGSFDDSRIRVVVNERNIGAVRNRNRCVMLSKGSLIKFLFQDDILYPTCVEKMIRIFQEHEQIGMVFSPRDVLLENPDDPIAISWKKQHGILHTRFSQLSMVNRGIDLFNSWLISGFLENWVGEPSNVMVRKSCLETVGLFNIRMWQCSDYEMWIRLMFFCDVGFIDEQLSAFRFHSGMLTFVNKRQKRDWLDRLWLLEGLLQHKEIRKQFPEIKLLKDREAKRIARTRVGHILGISKSNSLPVHGMLRSLIGYWIYCFQSLIHRAPSIHGDISS